MESVIKLKQKSVCKGGKTEQKSNVNGDDFLLFFLSFLLLIVVLFSKKEKILLDSNIENQKAKQQKLKRLILISFLLFI